MITYRIGQAPNIPWWRLKNMTNDEIQKFNESYITYTVQAGLLIPTFHCSICGHNSEGFSICLKCNPQTYEVESVVMKAIWNAAIEAAAKIAEKYESYGAAYEIRLEKKK